MAGSVQLQDGPPLDVRLPSDFMQRLETSLASADAERRKRAWLRAARRSVPLLALAAPILAWFLMLASPGGIHAAIGGLAWLAFCLDVGVRADSDLLSYLGLQMLPAIVGALLLVLATCYLLTAPTEQE